MNAAFGITRAVCAEIADRLAMKAVDEVEARLGVLINGYPEDLLALQHRFEELFYLELAQVRV